MSQQGKSDTIDVREYQALLERKAQVGDQIRQLLGGDGYLVLKAIIYNFKEDVRQKEDYTTLEDFRADRKALKIIDGLFSELDAMVGDGEQAVAEIQKLIDSEASTPSILSLDGEGTEDGQDS